MNEYKQELRKHPIKKIPTIVKNLPTESQWANFQISEMRQDDPEKKPNGIPPTQPKQSILMKIRHCSLMTLV